MLNYRYIVSVNILHKKIMLKKKEKERGTTAGIILYMTIKNVLSIFMSCSMQMN